MKYMKKRTDLRFYDNCDVMLNNSCIKKVRF